MQTEIENPNPPAIDAATSATEIAPAVKPKIVRVRKIVKPKKIRGVTTDRSTIGGKNATTEGKPLKQVLREPYFTDEHRKRYRRIMRSARLAGNRDENRFYRTHKLHDRHLYDKADCTECFRLCRTDSVLAKCLARQEAAEGRNGKPRVAKVAKPNGLEVPKAE
jgi:hypothetical protein